MTVARRTFAPEVIQTSNMDCGPASLKCLLEGFYIPASYGRLREACQTDVDGTSIDVLEDVANELGLDAEQIMLPCDHLLVPEAQALPALVVVQRPQTPVHFVVAWRRHGGWLQIMDPGVGRRWIRCETFVGELLQHETPVPLSAWWEWASSPAFLAPLRARMRALGVSGADSDRLIERATGSGSPLAVASLDAATRMLAVLARTDRALVRTRAAALLESLSAPDAGALVPDQFWSAIPRPSRAGAAEPDVTMRGAVLITVRGLRAEGSLSERPPRLSPQLAAAVRERAPSPWAQALAVFRDEGLGDPIMVASAAAVAALAVLAQAVLVRGLLDLSVSLGLATQRLAALAAAVAFLFASLLVAFPLASTQLRIGRRLEIVLRMALSAKLPRISERYFHSRLVSDMAERAHSLVAIRGVPQLFANLWSTSMLLLFTVIGLVWLERSSLVPALVVITASAALALASHGILAERDLRARSHAGTLGRYLLDALQGLTCFRAHGAERSLQREQEALLVHWTAAQRDLLKGTLAVEALQSLVTVGLSAWLVLEHVARAADVGSVLLFSYWALQLPALGQTVAMQVRQLPGLRNVLLRLMEPLSAPEEEGAGNGLADEVDAPASITFAGVDGPVASLRPRGVRIEMRDVSVVAGGHTLLQSVDLDVEASNHVAVVGVSGAGKSTLVGLLLGWHRAATGVVLVDGRPLDGGAIAQLRRETAWVDPGVHLFGKNLLDNLTYGARPGADPSDVGSLIDDAELRDVVERLPEGLQTSIGWGGTLVSGGEGQRVRLGRAMLRRDARLVILDEPFRGLDREGRRKLLARARAFWQNATLLCITHDVGETVSFPRVLVVDGGRVVEDGDPNYLGAIESTRYARLLQAEAQVRHGLWEGVGWRRFRIERGRLIDGSRLRAVPAPKRAWEVSG